MEILRVTPEMLVFQSSPRGGKILKTTQSYRLLCPSRSLHQLMLPSFIIRLRVSNPINTSSIKQFSLLQIPRDYAIVQGQFHPTPHPFASLALFYAGIREYRGRLLTVGTFKNCCEMEGSSKNSSKYCQLV